MALTAEQKEIRKLRKALTDLVRDIDLCLKVIDGVMQEKESPLRGKRIAGACNALDMAKDSARFFALGENWRGKKSAKAA